LRARRLGFALNVVRISVTRFLMADPPCAAVAIMPIMFGFLISSLFLARMRDLYYRYGRAAVAVVECMGARRQSRASIFGTSDDGTGLNPGPRISKVLAAAAKLNRVAPNTALGSFLPSLRGFEAEAAVSDR
jgi:hypothetical protein